MTESKIQAKIVTWEDGEEDPTSEEETLIEVTDRTCDEIEVRVPLTNQSSVYVTLKLSDLVRAATTLKNR